MIIAIVYVLFVLGFISVSTPCHMNVHQRSQRSPMVMKWGHQLTTFLDHNVASCDYATIFKVFISFSLGHTNLYNLASDPLKFSINIFCCVFLLYCLYTWVWILLVWCLNAWSEWSVPWVTVMLLQQQGSWHRDFALWSCSGEWWSHFDINTLHLFMLCATDS